MTSEVNVALPQVAPEPDGMNARPAQAALHVLTLTPFFPSASNPVYGTYVSEPIHHFADYHLHSSVIAVSPLHHERRRPLPDEAAEWLRYPTLPGNLGLTTAGFFLFRRLLSVVRRLHRRNSIDVIHVHSALPCGHAAYLLAKRLRLPFVVTVHGLDVFNACFEPATASAKRRANLSAEIYQHAASVICISRKIENILKEGMQPPSRSCVIYNGTDPQVFFPEEAPAGTASHEPTILIVGNLLRGKGHEVVLKAMAEIAPRFPGLQCVIIGEGPDQSRFQHLAHSLGIADRVIFRGRQDRLAVAKAMRECTIFALPSRFEGLGCAYLEAMASAKPVIACQGQGIGEIIQHEQNGWLIPVDGVSEMAEALSRLLSSADLRSRLGASARQTILDGLTLSDQARRLNDLYRAVSKL